MPIELRPARTSEADRLTAIAIASKSYWPYTPQQIDAWREELTLSPGAIDAHPTFVAESGRGIVGFYILIEGNDEWQLEQFWVVPGEMRRGVGRTMLAHAASVARAAGAASLYIDADPNAEPFYIACGATRIGDYPAPIDADPDRRRPQLRMQL